MKERRKIKRVRLGPKEYGEVLKLFKKLDRTQLKIIYLEIRKFIMLGGNKKKDT